MIVFDCPGCHAKLQVAGEHAGKIMRCPTCQHTAKIPSAETNAVSAEPIAPPAPAAPPPAPAPASEPSWDRDNDERDRDERDDKDRPRRRRRRDRDDREDDREPAKSGSSSTWIILVVVGVFVCCVPMTMVALLIPAVSKVRDAAARTQSMNNLKQIGLGFHSFHDVNRRLPFNGSDMNPDPFAVARYSKNAIPNTATSGSWGFQILPFVEQDPLFRRADRNSAVPTFLCPGRGRPGTEAGNGAWSDYFYNNYINNAEKGFTPDNADTRRTLMNIKDGTSNTIFVGHGNIATTQYQQSGGVTNCTTVMFGGTNGTMRSGNDSVRNAPPIGVTLLRDSEAPPGVGSWGGPFSNGALMCMGDGAVRIFPYQMPNFSAFLTPDDGEAVFPP
jgi:hypothetical protein